MELQEPPTLTFTKGGRTLLEKILIVLVVVLLAALIATIIVLVLEKNDNNKATEDAVVVQGFHVCLTKDCVATAAEITSYLDESVSPCDDLYRFACGRWRTIHELPEGSNNLDEGTILSQKRNSAIKKLLEQPEMSADLTCVKKAKDFYASCVNYNVINQRGDQPFKDMIIKEFGGWPLTYGGWSESGFDLEDALITLSKYGVSAIIKAYVEFDLHDSSKNTFRLEAPTLALGGEQYYLGERNSTVLMAYENLIYNTGQAMGLAADSDTARAQIAEIVDFEIALAKIMASSEDSGFLLNLTVVDNLQGFNFTKFMTKMMSLPEVVITDITGEEAILVFDFGYYGKIDEVLVKTSKRVLASYIVWRFVESFMLTQGDKYLKILQQTPSATQRGQRCSEETVNALGLAVGRLYVNEYFDPDAKTMVMEMVKELQHSFQQLLDANDWMDEETKNIAREKAEYMGVHIGYPDDLLNDTYLEEYYKNYTYNRDEYFENVLVSKSQAFYKNLRRLREPNDKDEWKESPSSINALYIPSANQIRFLAGYLQPPLFSKTYPRSINFGGVGYTIGHEITHGFDDSGRQFNKYGNVEDWWTEASTDGFNERAQCMVNQYGNYTLPAINMNVDGELTLGENIADNGGLKEAFMAYRQWVAQQGKEEPLLPGLVYTHNQLFFISFAQKYCSVSTGAYLRQQVQTDEHSPHRYRVIGVAQNSLEFSEAFNCPLGSNMNPEKKCEVW